MTSYDDIKDWWQASLLRSIFWCSIQTIFWHYFAPEVQWIPVVIWLSIYILEDLKYEI